MDDLGAWRSHDNSVSMLHVPDNPLQAEIIYIVHRNLYTSSPSSGKL